LDQEKEDKLKLLGLSSTQAHVYLTLIKSGRSSAKALSKNSGVACPDIYRIMNIFEKMGLVQKIIAHPKKYETVKIEQALSILIDRKREENKELSKEIKSFICEMKKEQNCKTTSGTDSDLLLFPATKIIIQKRKERIQNAQRSIDSVMSWKLYKSLLDLNLNALTKKAIERGVKFRFIIEIPKNTLLPEHTGALDLFTDNVAKIKYTTTNPSALITIYDKKEALIYTSDKAGLCDTPLLWTNNSSIVSIVKCYFEYLWLTIEMQQENPLNHNRKHQKFSPPEVNT
jgi:sugar-specific transcriptional regulator TrmB